MTQIKVNGHANGHSNGNGHSDGRATRPHPQTTFAETTIDTSSFFGKLRKLYSETVLKTQLDQLKHQGSYDAFKLGWHPAYEVRPLKGAKTRVSRFCYRYRQARVDMLTETRRTAFPRACFGSRTSESGESRVPPKLRDVCS